VLDSESDTRISRPVVPLPTQPPYTAHVGNLAFDLTEAEIENYFEGCRVISVRIMKDRIDNRPKGFGYVEFADLDSLKKALSLADGQLAGRNIRVSVAEPRMHPNTPSTSLTCFLQQNRPDTGQMKLLKVSGEAVEFCRH
jgi:RNA recognition motif-containing protein